MRSKLSLKIISDGTVAGTVVVDERGKELEGVEFLRWAMDRSSGRVDCSLQLQGVTLEVNANAPAPEPA